MAGTKVLLVDDEVDFTDVLAERMRNRGLEVETAVSGTEALDKTSHSTFDAIVLDLQMPGIDGIETLRRILSNKPEMQVILLTGHATIQKGVEALKAGAIEFLEKPVEIESLIARIKDASTNRIVLYEASMEKSMTDLLHSKGW